MSEQETPLPEVEAGGPYESLIQQVFDRIHNNSGIMREDDNWAKAAKQIIPIIQRDQIERMREPTDEMLGDESDEAVLDCDIKRVWQSMLTEFAKGEGLE